MNAVGAIVDIWFRIRGTDSALEAELAFAREVEDSCLFALFLPGEEVREQFYNNGLGCVEWLYCQARKIRRYNRSWSALSRFYTPDELTEVGIRNARAEDEFYARSVKLRQKYGPFVTH